MTTLLLEETTRLGAISELCLKLAGERDLDVLLQGVSHLARQIVPAQYASVGIQEGDGRTISGRVFSSGTDAASGMVATAVMLAIPVLRAPLLGLASGLSPSDRDEAAADYLNEQMV